MSADFVEACAPGRLDVMGGIADYSGSLVLQMPTGRKFVFESDPVQITSVYFKVKPIPGTG